MRSLLLLPVLFFLALPSAVRADEGDGGPTLTIGSKAPAIDIAHWVKGVEMDRRGQFVPLTSFEPGQITVLEFWATWCGPCVGSMPHLTALQAEYRDKGVRIIGVSDESLPKVIQFLFTTYESDGKLQNDRTGYTLTTDPDQSVKKDYFLAAGQRGIPTAFVIGKDGHIEWIGHPTKLGPVLEALVADRWDRAAYKLTFEKLQAAERAMQKVQARLRAAYQSRDWDGAAAIFDELIAADPEATRPRYQKFMMLLAGANRPEAAYACGEKLLEKAWSDQGLLNQVAWTVVDDKAVQTRNLKFALKAALRANELSESKDAAILDTLARVYFEQGELLLAVKWQGQAAAAAEDDALGAGIRATLSKYKQALAAK